MSGIGAIFWKKQPEADVQQLEQLSQGLRVYGRDRQKTVVNGPCGLLHAHCAHTTIHDRGAAPASGGDDRFSLVFDGRLDNRDELIAQMALDRSRAFTDAELAMQSWERWQADAPKHWAGEFAVIIWDAREQQLHAVRDHLGRRGLSFHDTPERIVIATAPKALFAVHGVPREADQQKTADQLVQMFHDGARSFYRNISRVLPAHSLIVSKNVTKQSDYWSLHGISALKYANSGECAEHGRQLLSRAVQNCLRGAVSPASFLTGGLDSSTVAVSALDHLPEGKTLKTYTWVPSSRWDGRCPKGTYGDERPFVEAIADMHPRIRPEFTPAEGRGMFYMLDDFIDLSGAAPRNVLNFCWLHDIHERAVAAGHDVLLDGAMGNATLSWGGDGAFVDWLKQGRLLRLGQELRQSSPNMRVLGWQVFNRIILPLMPRTGAKWLRRAREGFPAWPLWRLYSGMSPDAFEQLAMQARMDEAGWDFYATGPFGKAARLEMMTSAMIMEQADIHLGFRALHRIETRDPLSDLRLVEWCFGLEEQAFRHEGRGRGLVRQIMKGRLPDAVLHNRKSGRQVIDWHVRMSDDLEQVRDELDALADDKDTASLVDTDRLNQLVRDWPAEDPLGRTSRDTTASYLAVALPSALAAGRLVRRAKGSNR